MKIVKLTFPKATAFNYKEMIKTKKALAELKGVDAKEAKDKLQYLLQKQRRMSRAINNVRDITIGYGKGIKPFSYSYGFGPSEAVKPQPKRFKPKAQAQHLVQGMVAQQWMAQPVVYNVALQVQAVPQIMFDEARFMGTAPQAPVMTRQEPEDANEDDGDDWDMPDEAPRARARPILTFDEGEGHPGADELRPLKDVLKAHRKYLRQIRKERQANAGYTRGRTLHGKYITVAYQSLRNCPVREEKGYFMNFKKRQAAELCFKEKAPKTDDKHLGIELELCTKLNAGKLAVLFAGEGLEKHVTIVDDGSLRAKKGHYAYEICVLMKEKEAKDVIEKLCAILNSPVVDAYVNESCGFHLHVDMRTRDLASSYRKLYKGQKFLIETQPVCRMENKFCDRNAYGDVTAQIKHAKGRGGLESRYFVINPLSYEDIHTLEVRSHSGTTEAKKIMAWIALVVGLVDGEDSSTASPYLLFKTLKQRTGLSEDVIKHFKARMIKFKKYYNDNENTDMCIIRKSGHQRGQIKNAPALTIEEVRKLDIDNLPNAEGVATMGNTQTV